MRHDGPAATPQRFRAEVKALAAVSHPSVPRLIESNAGADGAQDTDALYLVTTLIEGPTLEESLSRGRPLPEQEGLDLAEGLLGILEACHVAGWMHGDLKPANVILRNATPQDPVLIDFSSTLPIVGAASGPPSQTVQDPRNDLMQVARILFACLTGSYNAPFRDWQGRAPHERPQERGGLRGSPSPRAPALRALFDQAFAISPARRFQSIAELRDALKHIRTVSMELGASAGAPDFRRA